MTAPTDAALVGIEIMFGASSREELLAAAERYLTCEHAASSYGQPVLVFDGDAYGKADTLPGAVETAAEYVDSWYRGLNAADRNRIDPNGYAARFLRA